MLGHGGSPDAIQMGGVGLGFGMAWRQTEWPRPAHAVGAEPGRDRASG